MQANQEWKKKKSDFGKLFEPKAFQHISLQSKLNQPIPDKMISPLIYFK